MSLSLEGKIALVTGASRGIGYAAAKAYAAAGAHVIAVARTVGGLEELDDAIQSSGGRATLVPLDLRDGPAIDRLGGEIYKRWGRLDILLANAGVLGTITPLSHLEPKVFDEVMATNVTANWRLIRSLDPLLRQSDAGRALFISSGAAHSCRPYWGAYAMSKAALEVMALVYSRETANTPIKTIVINPGALRTAMRALAAPGEDPATLKTPADLAPHLVELGGSTTDKSGVLWDFSTLGFTAL